MNPTNPPTIKVRRLAYVRVSAPDLTRAEAFLDEFGLRVSHRTSDAVYLRGTDPDPPCYVLTRGTSGVTAIAFDAGGASDLQELAKLDDASPIAELDEPCGGTVVRLRDPQGMQVEVVHGREPLEPIEPARSHAFNMDGRRPRVGRLPNVQPGPSHVRRIGHLVLESADPASVYRWYRDRLGLRKSDEIHLPNGDTQMLFASVDRGQEFVDHHVVGFQFAFDEGARVQHVAFEVSNLDDLMAGHDHLQSKRRKAVWGVGRHRYGGQIYDYWANPWGVIHEHWTDTDLVNEDSVASDSDITELEEYWGPQPTPAFLVARWNWKAVRNVSRVLGARFRASRRGGAHA